MRTDIYARITNQIVSELEKGVRPWMKPWNAEHAAGRITRPLRGNGIPYQGINVLMLWSAAMEKGYAAPIWMTFKQAQEFKAHVRKGEQGSLVVYADKIVRTETNADTGEPSELAIPFMTRFSTSSSSTACPTVSTPRMSCALRSCSALPMRITSLLRRAQ
jgi:antirestriction protein ArdC